MMKFVVAMSLSQSSIEIEATAPAAGVGTDLLFKLFKATRRRKPIGGVECRSVDRTFEDRDDVEFCVENGRCAGCSARGGAERTIAELFQPRGLGRFRHAAPLHEADLYAERKTGHFGGNPRFHPRKQRTVDRNT